MESLFVMRWVFVGHFAGGHVGFKTKHRFDASIVTAFVELNQATHGAVVGDGDRFHSLLFDIVNEFWNLGQTIQERIMSVIM